MAGKDGSTWKHDWVPTNAPAVRLKTHGKSSSLAAAPSAPKPARPNLAERFPSRKMGNASPSKRFAGMTPDQIVAAAKTPAPPKRPNQAKQFPSRSMGDTSPSKKFAGMTIDQIVSAAGGTTMPKPSKPKTARTPTIAKTAPKTTEQRITEAARHLQKQNGLAASDSVHISDLRQTMTQAGVSNPEFDRALTSMFTAQKVNLVPQSNQQALTNQQRAGAIHVGGQDKHRLYIN